MTRMLALVDPILPLTQERVDDYQTTRWYGNESDWYHTGRHDVAIRAVTVMVARTTQFAESLDDEAISWLASILACEAKGRAPTEASALQAWLPTLMDAEESFARRITSKPRRDANVIIEDQSHRMSVLGDSHQWMGRIVDLPARTWVGGWNVSPAEVRLAFD